MQTSTVTSRVSPHTARDALRFNLVYHRAKQRLSQIALAEAAGTTRNLISDVENGKANLTIDILDRLAIALDTTTIELLRPVELSENEPDEEIAQRLAAPDSDIVDGDAFLAALAESKATRAPGARYSNRGRRPAAV